MRRLAPAGVHLSHRPPGERGAYRGIAALALFTLAVIIFLVLFDWNWFRGPLARVASYKLNREVGILGDLDVHPWSLTPSAEVHDVTVAQPPKLHKGEMAKVGTIAVRVQLLPLFKGKQIIELVQATGAEVHLQRDIGGANNWQFGDPTKRGQPMKLPVIQNFVVKDGHVLFNDAKRKLTLDGIVNTSEHLTGADRGSFSLRGHGTLNAEPFTLVVTGAPLIHIDRNHPWPFKADMHSRSTHATADASIDKPFNLGQFGGRLTVSGENLADLYHLTGLALPATPPYRVSGHLRRNNTRYDFDRFTGRVGDSDLAGDLYVLTGGKRIYLNADAHSRKLDFDDVGPIFGLPPATGRGETASPEQRAQAGAMRKTGRLLPDTPLDVHRIRAMDADVTYRADSVNAPRFPLRRVSLKMKLKDGVLDADPVSFDFPHGSLDGRVRLDASRDVPRTDLDARLTKARLEDFIAFRSLGRPAVEGGLSAHVKLVGSGNSIHKAAASSNGTLTAAMPNGNMRQAFAELLGINLTKGLILLLSENPKQTPIRCAVTDFDVHGGVMQARTMVLDTGVVVAHGKGSVDLRNETLNFKIDGDSKKFRLVRLLSPITLKGPIAHPKAGIEPGPAIVQGVVGVALGAAINPLAAILPFVDLGGAKDAPCDQLLAQARAKGAR
jgi:uncharacterized protein involved in outer membrane biogenesis